MYKNGTEAKQGPLVQIVPKWSLDLMFESTNKQHLVRIFDYASQQTLLSVTCTPLPLGTVLTHLF